MHLLALFMNRLGRQEPNRDDGRSEHGHRAGEKHGTNTHPASDQPQDWAGDPQCQVEEGRVGPHGETTALGRCAVHRFDPEAGVDQRVADAGSTAPVKARVAPGASQISAWPAASINTLISATFAPPSLSGRWPKKM